ncbi:OmpA family protein [Microbulbifer guangxiensis]|uniref:OmpA family protein n=1 Tax=Microbulbifer guangxiensis TaxID=2904249 RepID=UPI001F1B29B7|nr:OmpA family protein [Microbulbifer guangxiensis]
MADNFLEMALNQLGSAGLEALGSAIGLPGDKQKEAVKTGGSALLAGMLNKGTSKTGMASIFKHVTESEDFDFSSIADVFRDPARVTSLEEKGAGVLDALFGGKSNNAVNILASALNLDGKTGGSLMKLLGPVVMSMLGKVVKGKNLDISGLASFLFGQKEHIKGQIPDGLLKELGVSDFSNLGSSLETHGHSEPLEARPQKVRKAEKGRTGFAKWFWPILIALAALWALNMCAKRDAIEDEQPGTVILEEEQVMTGDDRMEGQASTDGFASSFRDYLQSDARDPNREFPLTIEFAQDSAKPTSESVPDVNELSAILQENTGMTVAIEGHTSSEGDEMRNQALSQQRAEVVRQMLIDKGIDGNRITATGMGSAKPIADNATEEGKQRNRRITVRVVTFE